jgi:hypothetical protein
MPQPQINYTLVTAEGDRNMKTPNHHSDYDSLEQWLKVNFPSFKIGTDNTGSSVIVKEIYEGHNRNGKKIF